MRPYKVLIFIFCVMVCLAALCVVLPRRISFGEKELRWPTLAEVIGKEEVVPDNPEDPESPEVPEIPDSPDTLKVVEAEEIQPIVPKITVDSTTDSRLFLPRSLSIRQPTAVFSCALSMLRWRTQEQRRFASFITATAR